MEYRIKHSLPGRLRVYYNKSQLTDRQAALAQSLLSVQDGISGVNVNFITGTFLIRYDAEILSQKKIESLFKALGPKYLEDEEMLSSVELPQKQESLLGTLVWMTATHYLKAFLPLPVRTVLRVFNLAPRIGKGLEQVASGKIFKAEVLDASAIAMSLITGDAKTASNINFLLNIGDVIEEFTKKKSYDNLKNTMLGDNDKVQLYDAKTKTEKSVPLYTLKAQDTVVVRTGSIIPADGDVLSGEALVNQASITGEPLAVEKKEGASVFAGTIVQEGELFIKVRAVGKSTKIQNILDMIDSSQSLKISSQIRSENLADSLVKYNFALSLLTLIVTRNPSKVMSTLMVDYSCAMKLAAPIAVLSAMREAAQNGILVKGGKFLEDASRAETVVFDKTGTLTAATPKLSRIILFAEKDEDEALRIAACLEEHFAHPVAHAIVEEADKRNLIHPEDHAKVEYIVAHGIATTLNGKKIIIGSRHFVFDDEKTSLPENLEQLQEDALQKGESLLYLAQEGELLAVFAINDPVRKDAAQIVKALHKSGIKTCAMITGDDEGAAKTAAKETHVDYYISRALPEDKVAYIKKQQEAGNAVIMIGDGINDAPALAAADTGIAMGDSSAITGETADIVLPVDDSLKGLLYTRLMGKRLMQKIDFQNKGIVGVNSVLMFLGLFGFITPSTAALLHNSSTVLFSVQAAKAIMPPLKDL